MDLTRTAPQRKAEGAHYTPTALADFVATKIVEAFEGELTNGVKILDPACGDGSLLLALTNALEGKTESEAWIDVQGFDTSPDAVARTQQAFEQLGVNGTFALHVADFLDAVSPALSDQEPLFPDGKSAVGPFDMVIANPPYVRTQVMGAEKAQRLAATFNLTGRVDLYFAFIRAIGLVLKPGAVAGIIVSNRFMTTQSGSALRQSILAEFDILSVYDFGDTKLFEAAVLPAVLILRRRSDREHTKEADFVSVYSVRDGADAEAVPGVFDAIGADGRYRFPSGETFEVKKGRLNVGTEKGDVWRLATQSGDDWLATVQAHTAMTFSDVGPIRVGIKTTADKVFIRSDWNELPPDERPELLRHIITHHNAVRFCSVPSDTQVVYTHTVENGKRVAVDLAKYPKSLRYLEQHRERLEGRSYVREAGRNWFEIWVPQDPAAWALPKLVFRDISEEPMFWIDHGGSIVNGDCYWLAVDPSQMDLLYLAAAVGNSTFIEAFYDHRFNNKLYSGRRRFITQYVVEFPLPNPKSAVAKRMIALAEKLSKQPWSEDAGAIAVELDALTWQAFGLRREKVVG